LSLPLADTVIILLKGSLLINLSVLSLLELHSKFISTKIAGHTFLNLLSI